jgi:photosystem II stability/assembly factor-like uncharacterized protein
MVEGRDGVAYAWHEDLYAITERGAETLHSPTDGILGVASDTRDPRHLRIVGTEGVFDTVDRGASWRKVADLTRMDDPGSVTFEAGNLEHMMVSPWSDRDRPRATHDGGRTWITSEGCEKCDRAWFAPGGQVAWALGWQLFRSTDGGATFARAADASPLYRVVVVGAQPSPGVLVLAAPHAVVTVDLGSRRPATQELPMAQESDTRSEGVVAATFVPGAPATLCLGVDRYAIQYPSCVQSERPSGDESTGAPTQIPRLEGENR